MPIIIYSHKGKFGLANESGATLTEAKYDMIDLYLHREFIFAQYTKYNKNYAYLLDIWGDILVDLSKTIISPYQYKVEKISTLGLELFEVSFRMDNDQLLWGVMDEEGFLIIEPQNARYHIVKGGHIGAFERAFNLLDNYSPSKLYSMTGELLTNGFPDN